MRPLNGLSPIADDYDAFLVDLWGVIHDGIRPFDRALDCLEHLIGRPVLLLSNAPRRSISVQQTLRGLGIEDALYTHILTSGEATWQTLHDRADARFAMPRPRIFHVGPVRDRHVVDGINATLVSHASQADFVLNTGPDDERETGRLEDFLPDLEACLKAGLPMICANPDLEIVRGNARILCAGTLALWYETNDGAVHWIGKPYPAIYRAALNLVGVAPSRALAIGDSLRTDIAGADVAGIDSLWVLGGLHRSEIDDDPTGPEAAARRAGLDPTWVMGDLSW